MARARRLSIRSQYAVGPQIEAISKATNNGASLAHTQKYELSSAGTVE
jgi:hypothetical protein